MFPFDSQVAISYRHSIHCRECRQDADYMSSRFRDNGHQTYRRHGLDLSGSRDVIGRLPAEQLHAPHRGLLAVYFSSLVACACQHHSPWTTLPSCYCWDGVQNPPKQQLGITWWFCQPPASQAQTSVSHMVRGHNRRHRRSVERCLGVDFCGQPWPIARPIRPPGFDLPRQPWTLLNRFRTGHSTCLASLHHWGMAQSDLC